MHGEGWRGSKKGGNPWRIVSWPSMTPPESTATSIVMTAAEGRRRESWGERFARAASVFLDALFSDHTHSDCESPQREFALG
jgi:hypothetical protein